MTIKKRAVRPEVDAEELPSPVEFVSEASEKVTEPTTTGTEPAQGIYEKKGLEEAYADKGETGHTNAESGEGKAKPEEPGEAQPGQPRTADRAEHLSEDGGVLKKFEMVLKFLQHYDGDADARPWVDALELKFAMQRVPDGARHSWRVPPSRAMPRRGRWHRPPSYTSLGVSSERHFLGSSVRMPQERTR